jgi:hypothetical protein
MELSSDIAVYGVWSGYVTLGFLVLTIVSFILKWGFRFRFVGVTSFMVVVTASIFALGLGLFQRTVIPGAIKTALVYDNGADYAVVNLPVDKVTPDAIKPTLTQVAYDLFSPGRLGVTGDTLNIRLRTLIHPEPGLSKLVYLGEVRRSLAALEDPDMDVKVFKKGLKEVQKYNKNA